MRKWQMVIILIAVAVLVVLEVSLERNQTEALKTIMEIAEVQNDRIDLQDLTLEHIISTMETQKAIDESIIKLLVPNPNVQNLPDFNQRFERRNK